MRFWPLKKSSSSGDSSGPLAWDEQARTAIGQALQQAPVPKMLKSRLRKELENAAEEAARKAGRAKVTAEDVMNGMLSKMPANMRQQVEEAMKGGPEALKKLQNKFQRK
jgi:uncharacterized protein (DUF2342 family)